VKKILSITGIILIILIVGVVLFAGKLIKGGVNTMGPKLLGVPVSLENVIFNPISGTVHLKGLIIGNPEGFSTPSSMELSEFKVKLSIASLFSDPIIIEEILITDPQITYEKSLRSSNLKTLQENISPAKAEPAPPADIPDPAEEKTKKPAKKIVIEDFQLNGAEVNASITALGGRKFTVPLGPIRLQNIGKQSGGASPAEILTQVFNSLSSAVASAVANAGEMTGDALKGAEDIGGAAKDTTDAAKDAAGSVKKGLGELLGR
jgi:uncharacterized protein involved in outer membrane biogenesis